jgi:hypothetical protein
LQAPLPKFARFNLQDSFFRARLSDEIVQRSYCNKVQELVGTEPADITATPNGHADIQRMTDAVFAILSELRMSLAHSDDIQLCSTVIRALGRISILCSQREKVFTSLLFLLSAQQLYKEVSNCTAYPIAPQFVSLYGSERDTETAHTYTLFYLAQVYGLLGDQKESAR